MFSLKNKLKVLELEKQVVELEKKLANAGVQLDAFKKTIDKINAEIPASSFSFDFETVNVFSVERNINDNRPVTIIGYLLPEPVTTTEESGVVTKDVVREWYLYCNQEQHEKLIEEFNKHKGNK